MNRLALFLVVSFLLAAPNCEAQIFKKLGQELLNNATGQGGMPGQNGAGTAGQPAGQTSLPPGQYMMTNMGSGQGYYVMVDNAGQMYASLPQNGQGMAPGMVQPGFGQQGFGQQQSTGGGLLNSLQGFTGGGQQQQQQQPGMGGVMRGALGNFLNKGQQQQPVQQQY